MLYNLFKRKDNSWLVLINCFVLYSPSIKASYYFLWTSDFVKSSKFYLFSNFVRIIFAQQNVRFTINFTTNVYKFTSKSIELVLY